MTTLRRALTLISSRDRWTKYAQARNDHGSPVHPNHPDAVRWDAAGAIVKSAETYADIQVARDRLRSGWCGVERFNDSSTHDEVVDAMRRAVT